MHRVSERQQQEISVLFIHLDKFKHINDTYGHPIGDQVIVTASKALKKIARAKDVVARFSWDEFVFIVHDSTTNDASHVARRILNIFTTPLDINDVSLYISPSNGIARFPKNGQTPTALLKNADTEMCRAKHDGRNDYSYYSAELTTEVTRRVHLENMLRDALVKEEFSSGSSFKSIHCMSAFTVSMFYCVGIKLMRASFLPTFLYPSLKKVDKSMTSKNGY
jgi:diguanylate cyclase (GGDEF)-like protein